MMKITGNRTVEIMNYKGKAKYLFGLVVLISLFLGSIYPSFVHMNNHNLLYGIACMMAMDLMLGD